MKICAVGLGYIGLSNAILLAKNNEVIGVAIISSLVDGLQKRIFHRIDNQVKDVIGKVYTRDIFGNG